MVATMCGRKHKPPHYTTQEDRLTDQRWNKTQECWHTFLSEIAAQDSRDTPCPGHRCFEEYHFSSAGLESANAAHERHSYTSDAHEWRRLPQTSGAYHFDSSQPTHLQCVQESTPASHHGPSHAVQTVVKRRAYVRWKKKKKKYRKDKKDKKIR